MYIVSLKISFAILLTLGFSVGNFGAESYAKIIAQIENDHACVCDHDDMHSGHAKQAVVKEVSCHEGTDNEQQQENASCGCCFVFAQLNISFAYHMGSLDNIFYEDYHLFLEPKTISYSVINNIYRPPAVS